MAETSLTPQSETAVTRRSSAESRRGEAAPGIGLLKGLGVTIKHLFKKTSTQQYPHEKPDLAPRTRGVIALMDENCTVCMLCSRECPDWCIYIESHKETVPPAREGGRERTRNVLDRFAIDFALCMYCGICIEVCPFDALFWSPEFEYSEYDIDEMTHEMPRLREWMDTVPPPPELERGAASPDEVESAISKAQQELEQAREEAREEADAEEGEAEPEAKQQPQEGEQPDEAEIEIEPEIDQEVYDQLIEEGKSERIARAKAKAAFMRKAKKEAREEAAAEAGDAGGATTEAPAEPEKKQSLADVHVEGAGEQLDQQVYDELIAEGKSERIARARAKAAWVRKQKQAQLDAEDTGDAEDTEDVGEDGQ